RELAQAIELGLPLTPVEPLTPVLGEPLHVAEAGASGPRLERRLIRPACAPKARLEVGHVRIRHVEREGLRGRPGSAGHGGHDAGPLSSSRICTQTLPHPTRLRIADRVSPTRNARWFERRRYCAFALDLDLDLDLDL